MKQYRFLEIITILYVVFQLISDVTATKLVEIFEVPVSITVLYFPITYIFSDVLTEVYGYAKARRVVWLALLSSVIAASVYQLVLVVPPASGGSNAAFQQVLGSVPRVLVGGWIAVWSGAMLNSYIMAKMKIWTGGRILWLRTSVSTIFGEFANTSIFYSIALSGVLPSELLLQGIMMGTAFKVGVEILFTPWTCWIVTKLKQLEQEDFYDVATNFTPFTMGEESCLSYSRSSSAQFSSHF